MNRKVDFRQPLTKAIDSMVNDKDWRDPSLDSMSELIATTIINGRPAQLQLFLTTDPSDFISENLGDTNQ